MPTVAGHVRELCFGRLGETPALVLSGRELAKRIHQTHPGLPVMAASCCVLPEEQEGSAGYLQKPFTGTGRLRKVKSAPTTRHAS